MSEQPARDVIRDRDAQGRARNSRPRDASGRPLPHGVEGVERVPDDLVLPPLPALALAQRYLDADQPFHAHEVLEASWKAAPDHERQLWRGLAQICVGLTHHQRGNGAGADALIERGVEHVSASSGSAPYDIDVEAIVRWAASRRADAPLPRLQRIS